MNEKGVYREEEQMMMSWREEGEKQIGEEKEEVMRGGLQSTSSRLEKRGPVSMESEGEGRVSCFMTSNHSRMPSHKMQAAGHESPAHLDALHPADNDISRFINGPSSFLHSLDPHRHNNNNDDGFPLSFSNGLPPPQFQFSLDSKNSAPSSH